MFRKKIILTALIPSLLITAVALAAAPAAKVKTTGLAKIVLNGTVVSKTDVALTLKVTGTSKNVKNLKGTNLTLPIGDKTKITKDGKRIALAAISSGTRLKVFGIADKKTGAISQVRWLKISPK